MVTLVTPITFMLLTIRQFPFLHQVLTMSQSESPALRSETEMVESPKRTSAKRGQTVTSATLDPQSQARADMIAELEKKITEAFEVFDHAANKTVDVREVGTILRALGCVPTEAEIQEIIVSVEDQESPGSVRLERFVDHVINIITEFKMQPASAEELLKAFHTLDPDGNGYISKATLTAVMKEGPEPFTDEEIDEMMSTAVVPSESDVINYEFYINHIMVD